MVVKTDNEDITQAEYFQNALNFMLRELSTIEVLSRGRNRTFNCIISNLRTEIGNSNTQLTKIIAEERE